MTKLIALLLGLLPIVLLSTGCAVGPNYKRPIVDVPGTYRGAVQQDAAPPAADPDDLFGIHSWLRAAMDRNRRRLGGPSDYGHYGDWRDAGSYRDCHIHHPGTIRLGRASRDPSQR